MLLFCLRAQTQFRCTRCKSKQTPDKTVAHANYVMEIKDVEWIEQRHKKFEENSNLLSKLSRLTSVMYRMLENFTLLLNNPLINYFRITFIIIQRFYYYGISIQISMIILRK